MYPVSGDKYCDNIYKNMEAIREGQQAQAELVKVCTPTEQDCRRVGCVNVSIIITSTAVGAGVGFAIGNAPGAVGGAVVGAFVGAVIVLVKKDCEDKHQIKKEQSIKNQK